MRNLFVLALLLFSLVFVFADQHYVCTQSGDLDRWDVPTWKQDSVFSMGYTIYVDIYDSVVQIVTLSNDGDSLCMCQRDTLGRCRDICILIPDCQGNCVCKACDIPAPDFEPMPPDGNPEWLKDFINLYVDRILIY